MHSILLPIAPGYVIGKRILVMSKVYSPELSKVLIGKLKNTHMHRIGKLPKTSSALWILSLKRLHMVMTAY